MAISIFALSSLSLNGARPKIVASPFLANSISLSIKTSCSGVGGMLCSISFWVVDPDVLSRTEVANLRIEGSLFGHLDKGTVTFLLDNLIGDRELVVR